MHFEFCSKSLRTIHKMRAVLLYNKFHKTEYQMNICTMIRNLFDSEPSFSEHHLCKSCPNCSRNKLFPLISLNNAVFSNNFSNMEAAIGANFPETYKCPRCHKDLEWKREFGQHMFIEVNINILL